MYQLSYLSVYLPGRSWAQYHWESRHCLDLTLWRFEWELSHTEASSGTPNRKSKITSTKTFHAYHFSRIQFTLEVHHSDSTLFRSDFRASLDIKEAEKQNGTEFCLGDSCSYVFFLRTVEGAGGVQNCFLGIIEELWDVLQILCWTLNTRKRGWVINTMISNTVVQCRKQTGYRFGKKKKKTCQV